MLCRGFFLSFRCKIKHCVAPYSCNNCPEHTSYTIDKFTKFVIAIYYFFQQTRASMHAAFAKMSICYMNYLIQKPSLHNIIPNEPKRTRLLILSKFWLKCAKSYSDLNICAVKQTKIKTAFRNHRCQNSSTLTSEAHAIIILQAIM